MITQPYPNFIRPDAGGNVKPISNGLIYIGKEGLDPVSNPIDVFYIDNAGTEQKIDQPIHLNATGITVAGENDGTIVLTYTKASVYSILITDKIGDPKYTNLTASGAITSAEAGELYGYAWAPGDESVKDRTYIYQPSDGPAIKVYDPVGGNLMGETPDLSVFRFVESIETVESFGAKAGEDSTEAFQKMADQLGYVNAGVGPYLISDIKTTRTTLFNAIYGRTNITMLASNNPCAWLAHPNSKIGNGFHFDQNSTSRSGVVIDADNCTAYVTGENFTADSGKPTDISLVVHKSGNNAKFTAYAKNMENTGNENESAPRIVSVQDNAGSYYSAYIGGENVNTALLSYAGDGVVDVIDAKGTRDNGVYHAKGRLHVKTLIYDGTNEPYVSRAQTKDDTFICDEIVAVGKVSCVINLDNSKGDVVIGRVTGRENKLGEKPRKLWRTRSGQTLSKSLSIESVRGEFEGINFIETELANGELEYLSMKDVQATWTKKNSLNAKPSRWGFIQGVLQFDFRDWNLSLIDADGDMTSSDFFQLIFKDGIGKHSTYKNIDAYCYDSTGQNIAPYKFQANRIAQEKVFTEGVRWNTTGPYGREATYNEGVINSINNTPTSGFWRAGTLLQRVPPVIIGGVGSRKIIHGFHRQTTGNGNEATENGIASGQTDVLSDWRIDLTETGT